MALAWIFYGGTVVGLGALFLGLTHRRVLLSFSCCFWIGLALLVTALQLVNLVFGINLFIVRFICILGLFSFWLFRARLDVSFWPRLTAWYKVLFALVIIWIADRALEGPWVVDSGLYHFNSVRWANEQPLPPGLGNLHGRLAFNQSYFLFVSFVNLLPKRGDGHNFANSLLLVFTIITILEKSTEITRDRARKTILLLLLPLVFFFALLFNHTNAPGISSPSPDIALLCLQFAMFCFALAIWDRDSPEAKERQAVEVIGILLLSGLAVTFKLSSIVFCAGIAIFAIVLYLLTPERKGAIFSSLVTLLLLGFTWVTRSIIASGYLIYPMVATGCPVSWKVPPEQVRLEANWILSWAREPFVDWSKVLSDWSWLWPWLNRETGRPDFILALSFLGFAGLLLVILFVASPNRAMKGLRRCSHFLALAGVCTAAFCFWFFTAPDPRFLGAIFMLLPLCLLGIALEVTESDSRFLLAVTVSTAILGFGVYLALSANGLGLLRIERTRIGSRIPIAKLVQKVTKSGLPVWAPADGSLTWDAPLPATPYFRRDLQLRGKDLGSGFCLGTRPH
jgi:hypothetical protein